MAKNHWACMQSLHVGVLGLCAGLACGGVGFLSGVRVCMGVGLVCGGRMWVYWSWVGLVYRVGVCLRWVCLQGMNVGMLGLCVGSECGCIDLVFMVWK